MRLALIASALLLPLTTSAHHWIQGDYGLDGQDRYGPETIAEYEGEVLRMLWGNPHPRIRLRDSQTGGTVFFEAGGLGVPERRGLPRELIEVGDMVKIAALPPTPGRGSRHLILSVLLADGRELLMLDTAEPRWSEDVVTNSDSSLAVDQARVESARTEANGIFRTWTKRGPNIAWDSEPQFSTVALSARSSFDLDRDYPLMRCEPPGMPRAVIGNAWPIEFIQTSDGDIEIRLEEFDLVRTVQMDPNAAPTGILPGPHRGPEGTLFGDIHYDVLPSPLGYSVGHWDGRALVVETTRINWPYFDDSGLPLGDSITIVETFTLGADDTRLEHEIVISDPAYLVEPVTGRKAYEWVPGQEVQPYNCANDD